MVEETPFTWSMSLSTHQKQPPAKIAVSAMAAVGAAERLVKSAAAANSMDRMGELLGVSIRRSRRKGSTRFNTLA
jgi:hypothetical protein